MAFVYRYILKQALTITWRNKWLWVFGLFTALLGNGGGVNIIVNGIENTEAQASILTNLKIIFSSGVWGKSYDLIVQFFQNLTFYYVFLFVLIMVGFLVLLYLSMTTQGGILSGIYNIYKNKPTDIKKSFEVGRKKFWTIFAVNITAKLAVYGSFFIFSLPFLFLYIRNDNIIWQWVILIISFLIFVPFAVIVSFLVKYSVLYVVVNNLSYWESIKKSWKLFINNWLVSLEMAVVIFIINVVSGAVIIMFNFLITIPFVSMVYLSLQIDAEYLFWLGIIGGSAVFLIVLFVLGAILSTYQSSAWTLLFVQLNESIATPKLQRLSSLLSSKFNKKI